MSSEDTEPRQQRLDSIIADFLDAADDGHEPDRDQWLEEHAEFKDDLKSFLLNHDQMRATSSEEATIPLSRSADDETIPPSVAEEATVPPTPADDATIPPTDSTPEAGTKVRYFGDYELLEEIAQGGMGVVYKARRRKSPLPDWQSPLWPSWPCCQVAPGSSAGPGIQSSRQTAAAHR